MELEDQGHHVDTAFNGFEGKGLGLDNAYDVIILDLMVPGMNGRQVCRELRKNRISAPVMIMSALDSPDEREACISTGANAFMTKPFRFDDFYRNILNLDRDYRAKRSDQWSN